VVDDVDRHQREDDDGEAHGQDDHEATLPAQDATMPYWRAKAGVLVDCLS
jgi:hypothetical protein